MTRPVFILPEAEQELRAAMRWYEKRRPGLGVEFVGVVEHTLDRISQAPQEFGVWTANTRYRRGILSRFPFIVVFEERADTIEIVAFAHAKRRPGYWSQRRSK